MRVKKEIVRSDGSKDEDSDEDEDSPQAEFAALFTEHFDVIASCYPMLRRLQELAKIQAASKLLQIMMKNAIERKESIQSKL